MNFKNMLERFNDMESTTQASILTESTDLNAVNEGEERPYVCVHAKKGKHECHASSSYEAAKKAADHWGLKSTSGIDAHLADVKHVAEGAEQDREDSDQHTTGQTRLPFDESLKDIFEKLSGEMLNENTISMKPSQTIEKDGKPVGVVQDPNLATQLQRGLEQGTVSFDDELSEDLSDISDEANELMMYAENNRNLYNQSYLPIVKNLEKKFKKGTYDGDLAVKLWKYHADRAAKAYGAEHGGGERDGLQIFDPNTRREVAAKFAEDHFAEMEAGNFHEADDLREQSEMMGSSSHKTEAARLEGKSHALRKENYNCKYDEREEAQAYHEGYKEGLDQLYSATPDMSMPMIAEPEAEPELSFGLDSDYADDLTFESWDNELQTLLNKEVVQEGMNVSISKGLQGVPDQLTVTAQDSDAEKLMAILKQSEVGLFSDAPHSDYGAPEHGKDIGDHDQMMALMKTVDDHSAMGPEENMVEDELEERKLQGGEDDPCWDGYKMVGHKKKDGKEVPNCVPEEVEDKDEQIKEADDYTTEDQDSVDAAKSAITRRIVSQHADLFRKYGLDKVEAAIDDVAEFAGGFGLEEIGSSDVSGWVNEIIRSLEKSDDGMEEGNEFAGELAKARDAGDEEFTVGGKTYPVKEEDELTEWANDAGEKGTEQSFEQDIEFMTKVISGGLNKEKKDQTTLPHTKVKVDESESPSDWKKLAGIK